MKAVIGRLANKMIGFMWEDKRMDKLVGESCAIWVHDLGG